MMNRLMKDSGIEWVGDIPKEWKVFKIVQLFKQRKQKNEGLRETNLLSLSYGNVIQRSINSNEGLLPQNFEGYNIIEKGDIVLRMTDLQNDHKSLRVGLSKEKGIITSAYITIRNVGNIISRYAYYYLHSFDICKGFYGMGSGVRQGVNYNELKKIDILYPTIEEQQRIASFLDEKVAHIDSIVEDTKQSIENLKAYNRSLITETVKKGLDPTAHLKDSGIEWVGEIPEHWQIYKISQLFRKHKKKNEGMIETNLLSLSYGKVKRRNINSNEGLLPQSFEGYNIINQGDIVLRMTDLQNDHKSLRVGLNKERGIITSAYLTIRKFQDISVRYAYYYLHTFDIQKGFYGMGAGVRQGVNFNELKKLEIIYPPIIEQDKIADFLDQKTDNIDELIKEKENLIAEIEVYKKSLIYEYVTGKKEVK